MSQETYSLNTNFPSGLASDQLQDEITENETIVSNVTHINVNGDIVDIYFDTSLSGDDKIALDGIVAVHIPEIIDNYLINHITPQFQTIDKSEYFRIHSFIVKGEKAESIQEIKVLVCQDSDITSYDVKIYDRTNDKVIAEQNFTNTSIAINNMGTLNNLPKNESIFDVLVKRNGGVDGCVNFNEIVMEYV